MTKSKVLLVRCVCAALPARGADLPDQAGPHRCTVAPGTATDNPCGCLPT